MLLFIIALLIILIFAGAGLALHVLWWGILFGVVLMIAHFASRNSRNP